MEIFLSVIGIILFVAVTWVIGFLINVAIYRYAEWRGWFTQEYKPNRVTSYFEERFARRGH